MVALCQRLVLRGPPAGYRSGVAWIGKQLGSARETYGLPREMPVVVRLVIVMVLTGVSLPLIWWLASPLSPAVVALLAFFELVIVLAGLRRVLTARTFS